MAITMYGIKNCDTIKKARAWLEARGVEYRFHDYKTAGIERERLDAWCRELGWESVCNRAGTTFRKLPDADKQGLDEGRAIGLMLKQPSMIKRPMLDVDGRYYVGFTPESYARAVGRTT
jgi:arsenate reductase